jgi:hypothetical protein
MPRTTIGTDNRTEGATAHLTAHSKHNRTAPRRLQRGRKHQVTPTRQRAPKGPECPEKGLKTIENRR